MAISKLLRPLLRQSPRLQPLQHLRRSSSNGPKVPPTYYSLFPNTLPLGPPPSGPFDLDPRALRQEFFKLQQLTHPDTVTDPTLKRQAEGGSAYLNRAYSTLLSPLHRAQYILQLRGIDVAEDENLKMDDQELLMEVLEAREEIEEAQSEEDLWPMKVINEERIRGSLKRLGELFKEDDLENAKVETVRLRYWVNIRESLNSWEKGKPVVLAH
ncbi:uncharacterized protein LAJ45_10856 [Morchella importuna]|uniref:uncharacterized protein n=1 Tax=Morchella importuna TaxID=1174673 RepID=UPI001E8DE9C7|nr:uncharacterized protein LAJ45_10856 [Morchella importuna]KAH8145076.1 hypothetical protein LAJ45_10856 [Morchella importuna]